MYSFLQNADKITNYDSTQFTFYFGTDILCKRGHTTAASSISSSISYIVHNRVTRFFSDIALDLTHTVRNLHLLSKNSTLTSRENCRFFLGEKLVKMLWFWTF